MKTLSRRGMLSSRAGIVLAATAAVAAFPAAAGAAVMGSARVTSAQDLVPGQHTLSVAVQNNNSFFAATPANLVRIVVPTGVRYSSHAPIIPPTGWQRVATGGSLDETVLTFRATAAGLAPGQQVTFSAPIVAVRPVNSDGGGRLTVSLSDDSGATFLTATPTSAGATDLRVRAVEIVPGPRPVAPAGVTDGTATAGQDLDFGYSLRSHATGQVSVTTDLVSSTGDQVLKPAVQATIAAGETVAFVVPVRLRQLSTQRTASFTARATGAASARDANGSVNAVPPAELSATALAPRRVASGQSRSFDATIRKVSGPDVDVSDATLRFAATEAGLATPFRVSGEQTAKLGSVLVQGPEGTHPANIEIHGTDANGAAWQGQLDAGQVTIDDTAPRVGITATRPAGQDSVKKNDSVAVTVSVHEVSTVSASDVSVELVSGSGQVVRVPMTATTGSEGAQRFTGNAQVPFGDQQGSLRARARVADGAGHVGEGETAPIVLDNIVPALSARAYELSPTQIRVGFDENRLIRGGCSPSDWGVDGAIVLAVRYSDGSPCQNGQSGPAAAPDNYRILVLHSGLGSGSRPPVRYNPVPLLSDPVTDGAGNRAASGQAALTRQVPRPVLAGAARQGGAEAAYNSGSASSPNWHLRRIADSSGRPDLEVLYSGGQADYTVQVLDSAGNVLASQAAQTAGAIRVPIADAQNGVALARSLRFLSAQDENRVSDPAPFQVTLDTRPPAIKSYSNSTPGQVVVTFDEPIVEGSDFAADWLVRELRGGQQQVIQVNTVHVLGQEARRLDYDTQGGPLVSVSYLFTSSGTNANARRYRDRGGNPLSDVTVSSGVESAGT